MIINLATTDIAPAIRIYLRFRKIFNAAIFFLIIGSAFALFSLVLGLPAKITRGLMYVFFGIDLCALYAYLFYAAKLRKSGKTLLGISDFHGMNIAEFLSFEAALPFYYAEKAATNNKVDSRSFFAHCLETNKPFASFVLERLGMDFVQTKKNFRQFLRRHPTTDVYYQDTERIMNAALERAVARSARHIEISDVLHCFILDSYFIRESLIRFGIQPEDVDAVISWMEIKTVRERKKRRFWERENLMSREGFGRTLAYGYTPYLDQYSYDLSLRVKYTKDLEVIGHEDEIDAMARVLARSGQNNLIVVGEPGGGRKTILFGLVKKIIAGATDPELAFKKVVMLNMNALISGLKTPGEITQRVEQIFSEAQFAGNIIMVIDNIHHILSSEAGSTTVNVTPIIMPYLKLSNFQLVGITDFSSFHRYIEPNKDLFSQFEKVEIGETTTEETFLILQNMLPRLERLYGTVVTIHALREIIKLSELYMPNLVFPEKAINLLSEMCVYASDHRIKHVLPRMVADYLAKKVEAPIGEVREEERQKLLGLESYLHRRVIGQDEAISAVSDAMRRARTGVGRKKKPIGTFLFLGPTGVGKTETAKALAEVYFGSEDKIVRFDMSEYSDAASVEKLIGSDVNNMPGYLSSKIRENPFSVVLFDEIEKAHRTIHDLFLQVLDEGYFTDGHGQKVSFLSTIIIATSNAGAEYLRQLAQEGSVDRKKIKVAIVDRILKEGIFRPEFINRFDATVVFDILSREDVVQVTRLMLNKLKERLEDSGYILEISDDLVAYLANIGFDPVFGGRALNRILQEKVEGKIAIDILEGKYKKGGRITIKPEDLGGLEKIQ